VQTGRRTLVDSILDKRNFDLTKISDTYRQVLQHLRKKEEYANLMLLAWSVIENGMDIIFIDKFLSEVTLGDRKTKLLLDLPLRRKLEFLKRTKVISKREFSRIDAFRNHRNDLFHHQAKEIFRLVVTDEEIAERNAIMDEAVNVPKLTFEIAIRGRFSP
jgi:hypothetical protein